MGFKVWDHWEHGQFYQGNVKKFINYFFQKNFKIPPLAPAYPLTFMISTKHLFIRFEQGNTVVVSDLMSDHWFMVHHAQVHDLP